MATSAEDCVTAWQDTKCNVKERISHLFNNELMSDFTFIIDKKRIPVHKLILSSSSSAFYVMFYGSYSSSNDEIELNGISYDHFLELLRFIYTDEACLSWENVFEVLDLSKQYMIPSLTEKSRGFIKCNLSAENVVIALNRSVLFMEKELTNECLKIISSKTDVVNEDSFFDISLTALEMILALEKISMPEIKLFLAVDKWCSHQLNKDPQKNSGKTKRDVIGEAIKHVHFPAMSMDDFAEHCLYSELLTDQEKLDVTFLLAGNDSHREDVLARIPFPNNQRCSCFESFTIDRAMPGARRPFLLGRVIATKCVIDFETNQNVWFLGFTLFGDHSGEMPEQVTIETNKGTFDMKFEAIEMLDTECQFKIMFENPIMIESLDLVSLSVSFRFRYRRNSIISLEDVFYYRNFKCRFYDPNREESVRGSHYKQFPQFIFGF